MIQFFKDSWREVKHVVWPTKEETQKYFFIVIGVLIVFGIYIFIASSALSEGLFLLKDFVKNKF